MTSTLKCDVCKREEVEEEIKTVETEDSGIKTEVLEKCFVCKRELNMSTDNIKTEPIKPEDIKQEQVEVNTLEHNIDVPLANGCLGLAVDASFLCDNEHQQKKVKRELNNEESCNMLNTTADIFTDVCNEDGLQSICNSTENRPMENSALCEEYVSSAKNDTVKRCAMPKCKFMYTRPDSLILHNIVHVSYSPYQCLNCEYKSHDTTKFNRHILVHTQDRPYSCIHCDSCFNQHINLCTHIKSHHPNCCIKCDQCHYTAYHQTQLDRHKDSLHSGAADMVVLKCQQCTFIYTKSDTLLLHKIVHESDRPYECSKCEYKGPNATDFNRHILTHNLDKPHQCIHCNRCFSLFKPLRKHLKSVHPDDCDTN